MRQKRYSWAGAAVVLAVVAAACGASDAVADNVAAAPTTTDAPTLAERETAGESSTTTSGIPFGEFLDALSELETSPYFSGPNTTLPFSSQPCVKPAAHVTDGEPHEYHFAFDGERRPIAIRAENDDALGPDAHIWVVLHGAALGWPSSMLTFDDIAESTSGTNLVIAPQSQDSSVPFWSQSSTFNTDYLVELFTVLEQSVCLDQTRVHLAGVGQGAVVVAQGLCTADLPVDIAIQLLGMVTLPNCDPPNPTPLISLDLYDFDPLWGVHWDGEWQSPSPIERELVGAVHTTPDDLGVWAGHYNCGDVATEKVIPDPGDLLIRDSIVLSYSECDAPLAAIGYENPAFGAVNPDATDGVLVSMAELMTRMVGG